MVDPAKIHNIIMEFMGRKNMRGVTSAVAGLIVRLIETVSEIEQKSYEQGYKDGRRDSKNLNH